MALAALLALGAVVPASAAPVPLSSVVGAPIEGTWRTQNGTEVTIAPCPEGYCGTLSWIVLPKSSTAQCQQDKAAFGALMLDYQNENKALRTRPLLGMQMLTVRPTADPRAFTASIYNAEDGKTYDGQLWLINGDNTLRLGGGCLGSICAVTQDWPRTPPRPVTPDFTCGPG